MKIKKLKLFSILSLILILVGIYIGYYLFNSSSYKISSDLNNKNLNYNYAESIINEIKSVNKIVPIEIQLSNELTLDKSWGNIDLLKKTKSITFFAECSYYVDLSSIEYSNIKKDNNIISIDVPKPKIQSIDILSDKTIYNETELGLLRFGEIELSPQDYGLIYNKAIESFKEKMLEDYLYNEAISESKKLLKSLILNILNEDIIIQINFI